MYYQTYCHTIELFNNAINACMSLCMSMHTNVYTHVHAHAYSLFRSSKLGLKLSDPSVAIAQLLIDLCATYPHECAYVYEREYGHVRT